MARKRKTNYKLYQERHFGGSPPSRFYAVPCSYCGAEQGAHCWEHSTWQRERRKVWANPHLDRIARAKYVEELKA